MQRPRKIALLLLTIPSNPFGCIAFSGRRVIRKLGASAAALLMSACGGGGGGSSFAPTPTPTPTPPPQTVGPQYLASASTPFAADCNGAAQTGTLNVNAEVEPYLAVNPVNSSNLIGVWQQDRWSNGGSQGLVTGVSSDGGVSWSRLTLPFSRCAGGNAINGGDYERATDPWVTFSPDGVVHQIGLAFIGGALQPGSVSAVLVSRSTDGGKSWSNPVTLVRDGSQFFNDKETITADPTDARFVYAVWDRLAAAGGGPALFARTTDGGLSWEAARLIYDPGVASQTINNQIVVLPSGTLVNFFTQIDTAPGGMASAFLAVIRSTDKGATWSQPIKIADVFALGTLDPETRRPIRDGANLGHMAVGPSGELFAVWQDSRFSNGARDGVALSRSNDGGSTWSAPIRVNSDPSVQAFIPAVHARDDGTIGVTYYDLRSNTGDAATLPTDTWLARSSDGVTWRESRVAVPFDLALAPIAGGSLFLGDYQSLGSIGAVFVPFFVHTNNGDPGNRTDVFAVLANAAVGASAQASERKRILEAEAKLPVRVAEPASPLQVTPELRRRVRDSIVRTMQQRVPAWEALMLRRVKSSGPEQP